MDEFEDIVIGYIMIMWIFGKGWIGGLVFWRKFGCSIRRVELELGVVIYDLLCVLIGFLGGLCCFFYSFFMFKVVFDEWMFMKGFKWLN